MLESDRPEVDRTCGFTALISVYFLTQIYGGIAELCLKIRTML